MAIQPGTRLGPYEIQSPLGAGGMGEVYRARDTRLNRTVAVKILAPSIASDPEFRARFEREAQAIAALNHPHICVLHDIGHEQGADFLVMEHLEGETLARRLERGPLPLDQVIRYAREIADALHKAHRQGITHRDLKPGNVMLTKAGTKLLDFGLAKAGLKAGATSAGAVAQTSRSASEAALPTQRAPLTQQGTILGTVNYMAPEQLEGNEADARSDIFAFGCVLYEMLTARKAFAGVSQASVIAAVLSAPAAVEPLRAANAPPAIQRVILACLAKDPEERWQTALDLVRELTWIGEADPGGASAPRNVTRARRMAIAGWAVAVVMLVAMVAITWMWLRQPPADSPVVRFAIYPPEGTTFATAAASVPAVNLAFSSDGRRLAFVARKTGGSPMLWVRELDAADARALPGTEGASYPFWSPDGRSIGFFAGGKLKRFDLGGPSPHALADASDGRGGTWNREGVILFVSSTNVGVQRIAATGGAPTPATRLDPSRRETTHRFPQFLPDGRRFIYLARSDVREHRGLYLGSLDGGEARHLMVSDQAGAYAPPGYLLFLSGATLIARPVDPTTLQPSGDPFTVATGVPGSSVSYAPIAAAENGVLAFGRRITSAGRLTWFDRSGRLLGPVGPVDDYVDFRLSPDERLIALTRAEPEGPGSDVWLLDRDRGTLSRFTFEPLVDGSAVWSPDGSVIAFRSTRTGVSDLYQKPTVAAGGEELVMRSGIISVPTDWSRDGQYIAYTSLASQTGWDVWLLEAKTRKATPIIRTTFNEVGATFSPDRRWLAYASDESGTFEVYVQSLASAGTKFQVSTKGGVQPRWRVDMRELFYLAPDGKMMAVPIEGGARLGPQAPRELFDTGVTPEPSNPYRFDYTSTGDGQQFLVNVPARDVSPPSITVVLNWINELRRRPEARN